MTAQTLQSGATPVDRWIRWFALRPRLTLALVVLAALGAFMVSFFTVQQTTSAQDLLGSRAYQAARAGVGWGVYQVTQGNACPASPSTLSALAGNLAPYNVVVECAQYPYTEGGAPGNLFEIKSTASLGTAGDSTYVERKLTATIGG